MEHVFEIVFPDYLPARKVTAFETFGINKNYKKLHPDALLTYRKPYAIVNI